MADAVFENHRLAEIYDPLEPDRSDLDTYVSLVGDLGAVSVLDIGCGTGTLVCLLAERGIVVTGVDPAAASLDVARKKPYADSVRWIVGDVTALPSLQVDLVTMTGNVAQVFLTSEELESTFRAAAEALRPGGHLVFEVRDPSHQGWRSWNRELTHRRVELPDVGLIETWVELTDVTVPLVTFRWTFVFRSDGSVLTSDSTLRFWTPAEIVEALAEAEFSIDAIRDAPDRPGRELVFLARRPEDSGDDWLRRR
jgi:SAM-dependent methyltransferase